MSRFIQPLEQRMFLSASSSTLSTDLANVRTDATAVHTANSTLRQTVQADLRTLATDVRALKVTSNNKLLATLNHDNGIGQAKVNGAQAGLLATGNSLSAVVTAQGKLLLAKSNTTLRTRLSTNTANLTTKVGDKTTTLQSDVTSWQTTVDADLALIRTANPSSSAVTGDVSKAEADIATGVTSYNDAVNAYKAAIATLTADLDSIPG